MAVKVIVVLSLLAYANAGHEEPHYSPASSVSYSSFSTGPIDTKTVASEKTIVSPFAYSKSYNEPAPIYEPSSEDPKLKALNSNIIGNTYKNYEFDSAKAGGFLTHSIPAYYSSVHANPIVYHPQTAYSISSPIVHALSSPTKSVIPVAYTTHTSPLSQTLSLPLTAYSTSAGVKTSELATYASHASVADAPVKTTITYSEAPIVSHMSFSGLGTNYSW